MELFADLNLIFLISLLSTLHAWRITYPKPDAEFPASCTLENGKTGACHRTCLSYGKLCYFKQFEAYYCCNDLEINSKIRERPAVLNCDATPHFEIVSGISTIPNEYPFMVALGWEALFGGKEYDFKCGGVLITQKFVLTAAHCTHVNGLPPIVVLPGGVDLNNYSTKPIKIARIIDHPEYVSDKVYHDIAIIELQTEALVSSIPCIWTQHEFEEINLTAIGYGHTSFGGASSNHLLKAYFNVVPKSQCETYYERNEEMPQGITDKQLCAKDPESIRDTCQGDSGGPLIMVSNINNFPKEHVVGITSYGQGCALSPPGIYTRVSSYVDWIESIVWPKKKKTKN